MQNSNPRLTLTDLATRLVAGGFTASRKVLSVPRRGVSVSAHRPAEAVIRLRDLRLLSLGGHRVHSCRFTSLEQAVQWWREWTEPTAPAEATHLGGWATTDAAGDRVVYLDRTRVCRTRAEALRHARRLGEQAVYDLGTGEEVAA